MTKKEALLSVIHDLSHAIWHTEEARKIAEKFGGPKGDENIQQAKEKLEEVKESFSKM